MTGQRGRQCVVLVAALLVATLAGCADPSEVALDEATAQARSSVRKAATALEGLLRSPAAPRTADDLEVLDHLAPAGAYPTVFGRDLRPDGTVVADLAVHAQGHGLHTYTNIRMCVRLSGSPGPQATVDIADIACASTLPDYQVPFGTIDTVVHY